MKNIFKLSALAVLAIGALVSCEEKEIAAPEVASVAETHTFTVTIATPDTKVAVTEQGKTTWEVGDKILVHGETDADRAVVTLAAGDISADGKTATISFTGVRPYDRSSDRGYTSVYYAQYPAEISTEGSLYYYAKFDKTNDFLLAGYNEGDKFILYNLCGVISFKADGDFDSYTFAGNNGETVGYELLASRLAGKGEGNEPVLEWKYSHTKGDLTSIDGVATPNQPAFVCLPLGADFTKGFTLTLKKGEAEVAKLVTENPVNVERGKILPLGDITSKIGGGAAILKFEWRVEADTLVNVPYNEAGAAHWYVEKDADVEYQFKVYTDDGNVYTENGPGITIEPAANHVAINYAANDLLIPRKWMVTATTTANVEKPTLTAILIQGAYEYTDLAKLNADIIAAGTEKVDRIINIAPEAKLYVTKKSGKNVFAQSSHSYFTGGVLFYGTGLEGSVAECNTISGRVTATTTTYNGVPEITAITYKPEEVAFGYDANLWPCEKVTIADLKANYMKYVNVKTEFNNNYNGVTVSDGFDKTDRNGQITDSTGDIALYVQLTDGTITGHVTGTKLNKIIAWPTFYRTTQQIGLWSQPTDVKSIPGIITVDKTKTLVLGGDPVELGATTNSTGALSYTSSDEAVVTVSDAGLLTAVAAGTATITVNVAADGKYLAGTAECAVTVTAGGAGGDESDVFFEVYTGEITEGCYIIYYDGKAMNTTTTSNRLQYAEVSPDGDQIKNPANEIQWFIEKSGDNWTLRNPVKNDYAVSTGTKNQATTASEPGEKGLWTITETAAGSKTYEIVNVFNSGKEINANLRNNGTYGFATYATSTGGALTLYKKK